MEKIVIGLMGIKESGKSTVAKILAEDHGFAILEPGMQVMELLLDIDPLIVHNGFVGRVRSVYDQVGYSGFKKNPEGRRLLQALGTEAMRTRDPYFWVNQQLKAIESTGGHIVHASVRFPNEARLISGYEGSLWLIENDRVNDTADHESETAWREVEPSIIVPNHGTLSELRDTVCDRLSRLQ